MLNKVHRSLDSILKKAKGIERTTQDVCEKYDMPGPVAKKLTRIKSDNSKV